MNWNRARFRNVVIWHLAVIGLLWASGLMKYLVPKKERPPMIKVSLRSDMPENPPETAVPDLPLPAPTPPIPTLKDVKPEPRPAIRKPEPPPEPPAKPQKPKEPSEEKPPRPKEKPPERPIEPSSKAEENRKHQGRMHQPSDPPSALPPFTESDHKDIHEDLKARLGGSWAQPNGLDRTLTALAECHVFPDGSIRNVKIVQSSGVPRMDRSVLEAFKSVGVVPPLPENFPHQYSVHRVSFTAELDNPLFTTPGF